MRHRPGVRRSSGPSPKPLAARPREHMREFVPPALIDVEAEDVPPEQDNSDNTTPALWLVRAPESVSDSNS
mgnify:CR=1 FL=1